eukprot:TRINITY_DN27652_c0_g1_i6.p1 TRINITY_DN27652_c0_g1~~TRINITY_DN27652_c0_g1_i6.p1  ORF type:complete len:315 (-),score=28.43 TRINITY_DN27652_c0_g1_i6:129-1073(-)
MTDPPLTRPPVGGGALDSDERMRLLLHGGTAPAGDASPTAAADAATAALLGLGGPPPPAHSIPANPPAPAHSPPWAAPATAPGGGGGYAGSSAPVAAPVPPIDDASRRLMGAPPAALIAQAKQERDALRGRDPQAGANKDHMGVTFFRLAVTGEIESCQLGPGGGRGPLMCVFSIQHGADWTGGSADQREVVWNFPLGLVLKSTSPFGWPRIVVTVYGTDMCNRRIVKGYGSIHLPCQPGRHSRVIRLYCPLSSSPLTRMLGSLFGNRAQLIDPRIVAGTEGREVVRVQSGGKVRVVFDILLKDTEAFNYSFGS